jgi:hypothetical protein
VFDFCSLNSCVAMAHHSGLVAIIIGSIYSMNTAVIHGTSLADQIATSTLIPVRENISTSRQQVLYFKRTEFLFYPNKQTVQY